MTLKKIIILGLSFFYFFPLPISAQLFSHGASYHVCFTPRQDCTLQLVRAIQKEKKRIWIQARNFNDIDIMKALVDAEYKGVDVKIIFDKSQLGEKYSALRFLKQIIPIWIDAKPTIAGNNIFIFSDSVSTGSFNFTNAAQIENTENLLIIYDPGLVQKYQDNWLNRQNESVSLAEIYHASKKQRKEAILHVMHLLIKLQEVML